MYVYQYLISGILSIVVSIYIVLKGPRTLALKFLVFFGLVVSVWEISSFLSKLAADASTAANLYKVTLLTSHLCFPLYLLTVLSIPKRRNGLHLFLISVPVIVQLFLMLGSDYFSNFIFFRSEFGWVYKVVSFSPSIVVVSIIFISYLLGILFVLFRLARRTDFPLLRRKYTILFISFTLFQVIGTTSTNALLAFELIDPNFRIGGVLQLLTFLSIWYVLSLKEEMVSLSIIKGKDFSRIYSSFLTVFYNTVVGSRLGEEAFKFTEFISRSGLKDWVHFNGKTIVFRGNGGLDIVELINRNIKTFEELGINGAVIDRYLRVLKIAEKKLGQKFELIIERNGEFLKRYDLLYGVAGGKYLENIVEDKSLNGLDELDVCLKIYKRILLVIIDKLKSKDELREKLSKYYVTKKVKLTDYGEIIIDEAKDQIMKVPESRRISLVIWTFNSILSWIFEQLKRNGDNELIDALRRLRHVLTLNKSKAVDLGIYPTLLGTLATKIPQAQIYKLYSDYLEELIEERTKELREAQKRLLQSQRLAAIGEAAAMVGHDLRNPLQAIVNTLYIAKIKLQLNPNKDLERLLETIRKQVEYMNKIVSDLQDYARPLRPTLVKSNLSVIISETLSTIDIPDNVKLKLEVPHDLPLLTVDPAFIKRVLTNLVINAIQAMPDGGTLTIKVSKTSRSIRISVVDTGVGIPEKDKDKIFQPLFTTKSKGQGLGLAVCKRLVEALGGTISFVSEEGKGSTFMIDLPLKPHQPLRSESVRPIGWSRREMVAKESYVMA